MRTFDTKALAYGRGAELALGFAQYANGRIAILLIDPVDGEEWTKVTVNLPQYGLEPHQAYIKDWSENEGMLDWLLEHGLIEPEWSSVATGFVEAKKVTFSDPEIVARMDELEAMKS